MGFVKFDDFKIFKSVLTKVYALTTSKFEELEGLAATIITDKTGLPNPLDAGDAPAWIKKPAMDIISFFIVENSSEAPIDEREYHRKLYTEAIKELIEHRVEGVRSNIQCVEIAEKYTL